MSDVALLKLLRNGEEWLRFLCDEFLRENVAYRFDGSYQSDDPDCRWYDRERTWQDAKRLEDSVIGDLGDQKGSWPHVRGLHGS